MERLPLPLCVQTAKQLNGGRLWCGGKSEHRNIDLLTITLDFIGDYIFHIGIYLFTGTKGHGYCRHVFTSSGRMSLVNDNGKVLILQPFYAIHNIGEFLNCGSNNLRITVQRDCQIS